jgi:hypothetical protein
VCKDNKKEGKANRRKGKKNKKAQSIKVKIWFICKKLCNFAAEGGCKVTGRVDKMKEKRIIS